MMNFLKTVKCLCCLVKCSKYVYYIKKALCIATIGLTVWALLGNFGKCKAMISKLREM